MCCKATWVFFIAVLFGSLAIPAFGARHSPFVDFPVAVRSQQGPAGDTLLRFGAGGRGGMWPLQWGPWRLGFDTSGMFFSPISDGSSEVFVTPYTVELAGRGLIACGVGNGSLFSAPYGFAGAVSQLTLVHLRTFTHNAFTFDGDLAAMGGLGLAFYVMKKWLVRLDVGLGYGVHGLLWRTTVGIGMGSFRAKKEHRVGLRQPKEGESWAFGCSQGKVPNVLAWEAIFFLNTAIGQRKPMRLWAIACGICVCTIPIAV